MAKKFLSILFLLSLIFLILTSCSNTKTLNLLVNKGDFSKAKSEVTTSKYVDKSKGGIFARLDFELKEGKVDWEIADPNGKVVFRGYVINEKGITYRELTYPLNFLGGELNQKQEVKPDKASGNGINNNPDFGFLQFQEGTVLGTYTLSLTPTQAEGKYTVLWSDGIAAK